MSRFCFSRGNKGKKNNNNNNMGLKINRRLKKDNANLKKGNAII